MHKLYSRICWYTKPLSSAAYWGKTNEETARMREGDKKYLCINTFPANNRDYIFQKPSLFLAQVLMG